MQFEEALQDCQTYAEAGARIASEEYERLHGVLESVKAHLRETEREQRDESRLDKDPIVQIQMRAAKEAEKMDFQLRRDIEALYKRQKELSIVVFGRTMAGKSTLMEILTHGDGASIGKGAQRTTRDVRDYHWKGLKITDVPGIASFDGEEDDALAMEAAKAADMILFLITDDAPQESEAEKLKDLRALGKPVLGIVNVKMAIHSARKASAMARLEKKLGESARLDAICQQFRAFAKKWGQNWEEIPFVYTHLQAAYLADAKRENDSALFAASNFHAVERGILKAVAKDGRFFRLKTPIDTVAVPLQERLARLIGNASRNLATGLAFREKWHALDEWTSTYVKQAQKRYDRFREQLDEQVYKEIVEFAEENYQNEQAGKAWKQKVEGMGIDVVCRRFLENEAKICNEKRHELSDALMTEIVYADGIEVGSGDISMEEITTYGGKAAIAAALGPLLLGGPAGWVIAGIGTLVSFLSDSREEKVREAQKKLREQIQEKMDPILDEIGDKVLSIMNEEVLGKGIRAFRDLLVRRDNLFMGLAGAQYDFAKELSKDLDVLANVLFDAAVQYVSEGKKRGTLLYPVAYLPGERFAAFTKGKIPEEYVEEIERLLGSISFDYCDAMKRGDELSTLYTVGDFLLGEGWKYDDVSYWNGAELKIRTLCLPSGKDVDMLQGDADYRVFIKLFGYVPEA